MRFLFTSNPLYGHLLPLLPLVEAAVDAGHEVVVATGPDLVLELERRGHHAWPIGQSLAEIYAGVAAVAPATEESDFEQAIGRGMAMFATPAMHRGRDLQRLTATWRPDVVVREIYELGGSYVTARSGLQVLHGLGAHYPGFVQLAEAAQERVASALGPAALTGPYASLPYVDPFPEALQPPDDRPFSDVLPIRAELGTPRPEDRLPADFAQLPCERTVYLTLGTVFKPDSFRAPLLAPSELDVNVVVTCGFGTEPRALGPLPSNVAVAQFVPQALLLPRCAAVVSHAGAGTVIGALACGLPQVCLPRGADQFSNADQVARTGAGVTLVPEQVTPTAVRDAVRRILDDPSFEVAARRLQGEIAGSPTPADVLAELVRRAEGQT